MSTAITGQYSNLGSVTAVPTIGPNVSDSDPSNYFGIDRDISIEKTTNGSDSDTAPGANLLTSSAITWTYTLTNPGNIALTVVSISDDIEGVPSFISGDTNGDSKLDPTETWIYEINGVAGADQYRNVVTVVGTDPTSTSVTDSDPSHYFGIDPSISVGKTTNGPIIQFA